MPFKGDLLTLGKIPQLTMNQMHCEVFFDSKVVTLKTLVVEGA